MAGSQYYITLKAYYEKLLVFVIKVFNRVELYNVYFEALQFI